MLSSCVICSSLLFSRRYCLLLSRISLSGEHMDYGQQPIPRFSRSLPLPCPPRWVVSLLASMCVCLHLHNSTFIKRIIKWILPQLVKQLWKSVGKVSRMALISSQSRFPNYWQAERICNPPWWYSVLSSESIFMLIFSVYWWFPCRAFYKAKVKLFNGILIHFINTRERKNIH